MYLYKGKSTFKLPLCNICGHRLGKWNNAITFNCEHIFHNECNNQSFCTICEEYDNEKRRIFLKLVFNLVNNIKFKEISFPTRKHSMLQSVSVKKDKLTEKIANADIMKEKFKIRTGLVQI